MCAHSGRGVQGGEQDSHAAVSYTHLDVYKRQTQAYIRAGYSARTAHNCASRLMAKAGVRARIDELMAVRSRRTGVTQERVVRELARIAFVDPTQAIDFECAGLREDAEADDRAALMSVRVKSGDDFTEREVRLYDKVRALELLGKHLSLIHI